LREGRRKLVKSRSGKRERKRAGDQDDESWEADLAIGIFLSVQD